MMIEETNNDDINLYNKDYYDTHDVEYVDEFDGDDNQLDGLTLRWVSAYAIEQVVKLIGQSNLYQIAGPKIHLMMESNV